MKRLWMKLAVIVICILSIGSVYSAHKFYTHLDRFSFYISHKEDVLARKELEKIQPGWLVSKTLFKDIALWRAAVLYLIGDYSGLNNELKSKKDDYRAKHLRANAGFRLAEALYSEGKKEEALDFALGEVKDLYEEAIKSGPDSNFDDRWNYDLLSNREKAENALMPKRPKIKFVLGFKEDKDGNVFMDRDSSGNKFGEKKNGGKGNAPLLKRRG